jgi:hypothetical protein
LVYERRELVLSGEQFKSSSKSSERLGEHVTRNSWFLPV